MSQFPIQLGDGGSGVCMVCGEVPEEQELLTCSWCFKRWHNYCVFVDLDSVSLDYHWYCPSCTCSNPVENNPLDGASKELVASIRAIQEDPSLTDQEKDLQRQQRLVSAGGSSNHGNMIEEETELVDILGNSLSCSICMDVLDRPVTTQCGHNFCLECFQEWISREKQTCVNCRSVIPQKMATTPRINFALVHEIRAAKRAKSKHDQEVHRVLTQDQVREEYSSVKILGSIPQGHFGPILPEHDASSGRGVLVGDCYQNRLQCRQCGVHVPNVRRIAGKQKQGAQSLVLCGNHDDDEDHGEWFLYTGSGGAAIFRNTLGQSPHQQFKHSNEALRLSCQMGYPVRVVRSHMQKNSPYAPTQGLRYDGIYRVEKCWQKVGKQGFKVCRYLFVRCDNAPAPWTSDENGDRLRAIPVIPELQVATNVSEKPGSPSWDYDVEEGCWKWHKKPPTSNLMRNIQKATPGGTLLKDEDSEKENKRQKIGVDVGLTTSATKGNEEGNEAMDLGCGQMLLSSHG